MSTMRRETEEKEELASQLRGSLLEFCKYFFPVLTSRPLIVSEPIGRESHHITIARALTRASRLELPSHRLLINTPPGSGKSLLMTMFVAWTMAQHPDSKYIYVSYSKTLSDKQTEIIKRIMQLPHYSYLFDVHIRSDSKAKDYFQTTAGGAVASAGSSGSITGISAAEPGLDRFSGALICFPYDEIIWTEQGAMKIGEVVEKRIGVKVWSMNLETRVVELKEIQRYFDNPGSDLVEIAFEGGKTLRCTPDHKIWTDNRGWVEAQNLLLSDQLLSPSPNCSLRHFQDISRFFLCDTKVSENGIVIATKCEKFKASFSFSFSRSSCFGLPASCVSPSNFMNGKCVDIEHFSNLLITQIAVNNKENVICRENATMMPFSLRKGAVENGVSYVFSPCSVPQVFNSVVKTVSVYMTNISLMGYWPNKSCGYESMYTYSLPKAGNACSIIFFIRRYSELLNPLRLHSKSPVISIFNSIFLRSNSPNARHAISKISVRNISPLFVRKIGHVDKTYCLTVKDNNNMFLGSCEDILILTKNCDDLHKPDEVHSSTVRQSVIDNYSQTLQQRLRSIKAPIIMIGQRLHENDISQYLIDGKDGYEWEKVILKAVDPAGNILYPEVYSREMLTKKKQSDPYVYSSQYQQEPVPAGGALFKPEWFVLLDDEPTFLATFVVADTAETAMTYNDATAISFFGVYEIENFGVKTGIYALHWIDAIEVHVEPKDLKDTFISFWENCCRNKTPPRLAAIEKKSTGVSLISALSDMRAIRIVDIQRNRGSGSKTKRFLDTQPLVAERLISLPRYAKHTEKCIEHMSKITANDSHARDDLGDTLADGVRLGLTEKIALHHASADSDYTDIAKSLTSHSNFLGRLRQKAYTS